MASAMASKSGGTSGLFSCACDPCRWQNLAKKKKNVAMCKQIRKIVDNEMDVIVHYRKGTKNSVVNIYENKNV